MESQDIYRLGRLRLEQAAAPALKGRPARIDYAFETNFSPDFSLAMPGRVLSTARYVFNDGFAYEARPEDTYLLLRIDGGAVRVACRGRAFTAGAGDCLFLHLEQPYTLRQEGEAPLQVLLLRCSGYLCATYHRLLFGGSDEPAAVRPGVAIDAPLDKIRYYMQYPTNRNHVLMVDGLLQIFTELYLASLGGAERDSETSHQKWFVETVAYIEAHHTRDIPVRELAGRLDMSESRFYRLFKEYTGCSPHQYLIRVRLQHAQKLLLTTREQVKYVAYTAGFTCVNHFIRYFRRETGCTPADYRALHAGEAVDKPAAPPYNG